MDIKKFRSTNYHVKERHPWALGRVKILTEIVSAELNPKISDGPPRYRVLDFGCGDAWTIEKLKRTCPDNSEVVAYDANMTMEDQQALSARSDLKITNHPPSGQFDLIFVLDVLEHIENDHVVLLTSVLPLLKMNGRLLVTVPYGQHLFSNIDQHQGHFRRYSLNSFRKTLESSQLKVLKSGSFFPLSLFLFRILLRLKIHHLFIRVNNNLLLPQNFFVKWLSTIFFSVDTLLSVFNVRLNLKIPGLSLWAVCKRKDDPID